MADHQMTRTATTLLALLLVAAAGGCGSDDDVARPYTGIETPPCDALGTPDLVAAGYDGLQPTAPDEQVEGGDVEHVATCTVEASSDGVPPPGLPAHVTVAVTVSVLEQGDPAADFSRLADYADGLYEPSMVNGVQESSGNVGDGWWSRGTYWRTSWIKAGAAPEQLVETAAASRDNVLVSVLVVERDLAEGSRAGAGERVHRLVEQQLEAAQDAVTTS